MADASVDTGERRGRSPDGDAAFQRLGDLIDSEAGSAAHAYPAAELVFVHTELPEALRAAANWLEDQPDFVARTLWFESIPGGREAAPQWFLHVIVETE